jgi:hypothetical protein
VGFLEACMHILHKFLYSRMPGNRAVLNSGLACCVGYRGYTAISSKVVHEQNGKVEYERERLLGSALKIH